MGSSFRERTCLEARLESLKTQCKITLLYGFINNSPMNINLGGKYTEYINFNLVLLEFLFCLRALVLQGRLTGGVRLTPAWQSLTPPAQWKLCNPFPTLPSYPIRWHPAPFFCHRTERALLHAGGLLSAGCRSRLARVLGAKTDARVGSP